MPLIIEKFKYNSTLFCSEDGGDIFLRIMDKYHTARTHSVPERGLTELTLCSTNVSNV